MEAAIALKERDDDTVCDGLYLETKGWLSKIEFLEAEIRIFQNLLQRLFLKQRRGGLALRVESVCRQIPDFEKRKNRVLDRIFCHQSNLKANFEKLMNLRKEYLIAENRELEESVNQLQDYYSGLRMQLVQKNM